MFLRRRRLFFLTYISSSGTCALVFLRPLHVISNRKGLPFIPFLFRVPLRSSSIPTQTSLYWGISVGLLHRSSCCPRNRNTVLKTQPKWEQITERDKCTQTEYRIGLFVKVASLWKACPVKAKDCLRTPRVTRTTSVQIKQLRLLNRKTKDLQLPLYGTDFWNAVIHT